jgi:predicted nucleotidyltransferase
MFTTEYREDVRNKILEEAKHDSRIVSAAIVGSYAQYKQDQFSDIDIMFGVSKLHTVSELLQSWTEYIVQEFSAVMLLDVQRGTTIYRVFMLPGCLQVDISFSPEKDFGAIGEHFKLLYGKQYEKPQSKKQTSEELFGWIIHHLVRAKFCVKRNRLWQAEFWLSEARDYALKIACIANNLNSDYARGFDDLPKEILGLFKNTMVKEVNKTEILRVHNNLMLLLPKLSNEVNQMVKKANTILNELKVL